MYAVQTVGRGGSKPLIFVAPQVDSRIGSVPLAHDLSGDDHHRADGFAHR